MVYVCGCVVYCVLWCVCGVVLVCVHVVLGVELVVCVCGVWCVCGVCVVCVVQEIKNTPCLSRVVPTCS